MKKLLTIILILATFLLAGSPQISATSGQWGREYECLYYEGLNLEVGASRALVWYGQNIGGFASIGIEDLEATSGNVTTVNCMPIYANKTEMTGEDATLTEGTDLTAIKSNNYKFTYYSNVAITTNVTFNFLIAD